MRKRILVKSATGIDNYPVKKVGAYNDGIVVEYKTKLFKKDIAYGSDSYKPEIVNGVMYFGKNAGNSSLANVLMIGDSTDKNSPGDDLSLLIEADIIKRGMQAFYGKKNSWIMYLVIGAVILIVVAGGYLYWQNSQKKVQVPVQNKTEQVEPEKAVDKEKNPIEVEKE